MSMRQRISRLVLCLCLGLQFLISHKKLCSEPVHDSFGYFTYQRNLGKGIGYDRGYNSLKASVIGNVNESLSEWLFPFVDLRGHRLDDGSYATNIGFGSRYYAAAWNMLIGGNFYYDYREFHQSDLNQIGLGAEVLTPFLNVRCNAYIPVGVKRTHTKTCVFNNYEEGYIVIKKRTHRVRKGFDLELETLIARLPLCRMYGSLGTYYVAGAHCGTRGVGGQMRFTAYWFKYLTSEVKVSTDRVFGTRFQGQVAFTIPFGPDVGDDNFWMPVQRREIIATHKQCSWFTNF
jgi:hypothetical protein